MLRCFCNSIDECISIIVEAKALSVGALTTCCCCDNDCQVCFRGRLNSILHSICGLGNHFDTGLNCSSLNTLKGCHRLNCSHVPTAAPRIVVSARKPMKWTPRV